MIRQIKCNGVPVILNRESSPFCIYIGSQSHDRETVREATLGSFICKVDEKTGNVLLKPLADNPKELWITPEEYVKTNQKLINRYMRMQFVSTISSDCTITGVKQCSD